MSYNFNVNSTVTQGFYNTGFLSPHAVCTDYQAYYARYLLQKVLSVYDFKFPKDWAFGLDDYFKYNLFISGNIPVFYDKTHGFICQWGAYSGVNIALRPEYVTFQNQFFTGVKRKIGIDAVIFSLTPDYCGIWDKITAYAELLAEMHVAIKVNIINSKNPTVYNVPDFKIAQDMAKMFDTVQSGEPAVFSRKNSNAEWQSFNPQTKQNYITNDMLIDMRKIVNMFCTDFGLPNSNTDKKERLIKDEVNSNNAETQSWLDMTIDRLNLCCNEVERIFGKRYIDVEKAVCLRREDYVKTDINIVGTI